jgi:hypothetical protein
MNIRLLSVFGCACIFLGSGGLAAQPTNTLAEEKICKSIGFRPKTEAFGSCVLELVDRDIPTSTAPGLKPDQPQPKIRSSQTPKKLAPIVPEPKAAPNNSEGQARTYYANGVTITCVNENGRTVCR